VHGVDDLHVAARGQFFERLADIFKRLAEVFAAVGRDKDESFFPLHRRRSDPSVFSSSLISAALLF
jgi:hypothetical protein